MPYESGCRGPRGGVRGVGEGRRRDSRAGELPTPRTPRMRRGTNRVHSRTGREGEERHVVERSRVEEGVSVP